MQQQEPRLPEEDEGVESLLRRVGAREDPSEAARTEVYAATHAAWRSMLVERVNKRRRMTFGIAAGIAVMAAIAGAIALKGRFDGTAAEPVSIASVVRVQGQLQISAASRKDWGTRGVGQPVASGETLLTDADSRVALDFGNGLSVRIDRSTKIEAISRDRLRLDSGALYVDAGPHSDRALVVETPTATVRHLGTQYSVRTANGGTEVSVREGRVSITDNRATHMGQSGEKIHLTATGAINRSALPPQGADWDWAMSIAPPFDIEGNSLESFLEWMARETGRKLVYASDETRMAAAQARLHGSIEGLDPNTALETVLSTTRLRRYETRDEILGIELPTDHAP